jgi:hypothetical protein
MSKELSTIKSYLPLAEEHATLKTEQAAGLLIRIF